MDFDAESHNSLNIVIPGYLMKINEALSGKEVYNEYGSGKWRDREHSEKQVTQSRNAYSQRRNTQFKKSLE